MSKHVTPEAARFARRVARLPEEKREEILAFLEFLESRPPREDNVVDLPKKDEPSG